MILVSKSKIRKKEWKLELGYYSLAWTIVAIGNLAENKLYPEAVKSRMNKKLWVKIRS